MSSFLCEALATRLYQEPGGLQTPWLLESLQDYPLAILVSENPHNVLKAVLPMEVARSADSLPSQLGWEMYRPISRIEVHNHAH
jgi:hypothetical protein